MTLLEWENVEDTSAAHEKLLTCSHVDSETDGDGIEAYVAGVTKGLIRKCPNPRILGGT